MRTSFAFLVILLIGLSACKRELYQRPVTIDRLEFANSAGQKYEAQFQRVNGWFLQKIENLEKEKHTFRVDTTAKKLYHKYNHTLVAALENMEVNGNPGVYYQLYLRPNSGIGKNKGGRQKDMYNELLLFSPEKVFLQHEEGYYNDSIVIGPFNRLINVQELYEPVYREEADLISFSIDSINFGKGFKKRQKESIMRLINNSVVLTQQRYAGRTPKTGMVFNYYPNYRAKTAKKKATYALNLNVSQDPIADKVTVHISSPGFKPDEWTSTDRSFNRRNFFDGHDYEANMSLNTLALGFMSRLYYAPEKQ